MMGELPDVMYELGRRAAEMREEEMVKAFQNENYPPPDEQFTGKGFKKPLQGSKEEKDDRDQGKVLKRGRSDRGRRV